MGSSGNTLLYFSHCSPTKNGLWRCFNLVAAAMALNILFNVCILLKNDFKINILFERTCILFSIL